LRPILPAIYGPEEANTAPHLLYMHLHQNSRALSSIHSRICCDRIFSLLVWRIDRPQLCKIFVFQGAARRNTLLRQVFEHLGQEIQAGSIEARDHRRQLLPPPLWKLVLEILQLVDARVGVLIGRAENLEDLEQLVDFLDSKKIIDFRECPIFPRALSTGKLMIAYSALNTTQYNGKIESSSYRISREEGLLVDHLCKDAP
jgi:hypothetical protein